MPGMTIGIDCRFAATHSGLGRYTRELVTHLLRRTDDVEYVLFSGEADPVWLSDIPAARYKIQNTKYGHYSFAEQLRFPLDIKRARIDLLFSPHFNVPLVCPVPFVATIHDLILHRYPNQASGLRRHAYRAVMRHTVRGARKLIAVSAFTAGELAKEYGPSVRKKITVIHEAASQEFSKKSGASCAPVLKKHGLKKPFFLYVGNAKEHKNVQMLIDAYKSLGSTGTELVLVTGGREAASLRLCDGVRLISDVDHHDLPCLYFFAACFVTASLYEGFGLPVMEAAAAGCPVIVTNRGSLPEIAPPGSHVVEPTVEALADALREPPAAEEAAAPRTWGDVALETAGVLMNCL